ncbi:SMI1/KNR4 family protein [Heyndrickxia ginsengihumi]|uniref:SMI1/KNR4 family protein n=1 Tax=Heyndrickxia ginsengihumi TaxID=363870 RepID=UPI00203B27ED|nr:SMI1/KNR4 family protein [Heyndrickxia ginsengihumi]MCM3024406.1 SMI1/KNR4 family protein [Heyndrickxia ginsengihumi]
MKWVLTKPLENMQLLKEFEEKNSIQLPKCFIDVVMNNNYGRPRPNIFDTDQTKERIAKALLSFDKKHSENIWDTYYAVEKQLPADVYPFMIDQFGNYVCFYYDPLLDTPSIIFFDLESQKVEKVADTFEQFLTVFYEL